MLCPGCVARAIPQPKAVNELFVPRGAIVLGLHTVFEHHDAMTTTSLRAFLRENRITWPVGVDSPSDDGGPVPQTMQAYNMQGTPTLLLIDRARHLPWRTFGHFPDIELGATIAGLIAERACLEVDLFGAVRLQVPVEEDSDQV
jgi:hypothetical protein